MAGTPAHWAVGVAARTALEYHTKALTEIYGSYPPANKVMRPLLRDDAACLLSEHGGGTCFHKFSCLCWDNYGPGGGFTFRSASDATCDALPEEDLEHSIIALMHHPWMTNVGHYYMAMTTALFLQQFTSHTLKLDLPTNRRPRHSFAVAFEAHVPARLTSKEAIQCARDSYTISWDKPTDLATSHPFAFPGFRAQAQDILLTQCGGWRPDSDELALLVDRRDVPRLRSKIILREARFRRGIKNLGAVQDTLALFGSVDTVYLQAGSLCDQARNASGADLYVVPHGAHLINMVFFPLHAVVIEVFAYMFMEPCYQLQGTSLGLTMVPHVSARMDAFDARFERQFAHDTARCMENKPCRKHARSHSLRMHTPHIVAVVSDHFGRAYAAAADVWPQLRARLQPDG